MESHYLLGRCHMLLWLYQDHSHEDFLRQAYNAYQEALYSDGDRCSTVWISTALLFFYANQYYDCLNNLTRSIRLDPYEPHTWRNLGILVSSTFSNGRRCLQLTIALSTTTVSIKNKM